MRASRRSMLPAALAALLFSACGPAGTAPFDVAPADDAELTVFLSDPELGTAGAYRRGEEVVWFETARGPDVALGTAEALSVRLVDASGRTVALAGRSMAAVWLADEAPHAAELARASALLPELAARLAGERTIPAAERQALAGLAGEAGAATLAAPLHLDLEAALALRSADALRSGAAQGVELRRVEDGAVEARFRGRTLVAADRIVPVEPGEAGAPWRTETYAALLDQDGQVVAAQLGGDEVPQAFAWPFEVASIAVPLTARARIAAALERGQLVQAAQAVGRARAGAAASPLSAAQQAAFVALGRELRAGLLPVPAGASAAGAGITAAASGIFQTEIKQYSGTTSKVAEHSATLVTTTTVISGVRYPYRTLSFCNHGRCYNGSGMTRKCTYTSPMLQGPREPVVRVLPKGDKHAGTLHSCATAQNWASTCGTFGCYHNCHDDTWTQVRYVRGLPASPTGYRCADTAFHPYAPGCSGN